MDSRTAAWCSSPTGPSRAKGASCTTIARNTSWRAPRSRIYQGRPKPSGTSGRLLRGLERDDGESAVQHRKPAFRRRDRCAGARRVVVVALHRFLQLLVGELDAADELDSLLSFVRRAGVLRHGECSSGRSRPPVRCTQPASSSLRAKSLESRMQGSTDRRILSPRRQPIAAKLPHCPPAKLKTPTLRGAGGKEFSDRSPAPRRRGSCFRRNP